MKKKILFQLLFLLSAGIAESQNITGRIIKLPEQFDATYKGYEASEQIVTKPNQVISSSNGAYRLFINPDLVIPAETVSVNTPTVLSELPDTQKEIGGFGESWNVLPNGQSTVNVPIQLPTAPGNAIPNLNLSFNSQGLQGMFGDKWELTGIMNVSLANPEYYYDGVTEEMRYDQFAGFNAFVLNGERLLPYPAFDGNNIDQEFRTENTSGQKIRSVGQLGSILMPEYFIVETKDGLTIELGRTDNSRLTSRSSEKVLTWFVSKITDRNGNYAEFEYLKSETALSCVISKIKYGGHTSNGSIDQQPYNLVEFFYETMTDNRYSFVGGSRFLKDKVIYKIDISVEGTLINQYRFNYSTLNNGTYLSSIEKYDGKGNSINPLKMVWNNNQPTFSQTNSSNSIFQGNSYQYLFADLIEDSKPELIVYTHAGANGTWNSGITFLIYRVKSDGTYESVNSVSGSSKMVTAFQFIKVKNESKPQLMITEAEIFGSQVSTTLKFKKINSAGTSFQDVKTYTVSGDFPATFFFDHFVEGVNFPFQPTLAYINFRNSGAYFTALQGSIEVGGDGIVMGDKFLVGDFDGDRIKEVVAVKGTKFYIYEFSGGSLKLPKVVDIGYTLKDVYTMDVNADGKEDLICNTTNDPLIWYAVLSNGSGFEPKREFGLLGSEQDFVVRAIIPFDFNGDKWTDYAVSYTKKITQGSSTSYKDIIKIITTRDDFNQADSYTLLDQPAINMGTGGVSKDDLNIGFVDIDLNGIPEIFHKYSTKFYISGLKDCENNGSLRGYVNSNGIATEFSYDKLTSSTHYQPATLSGDQADLVAPLPLCVGVKTYGPTFPLREYEYNYGGFFYLTNGKALTGQKSHTVIDKTENKKVISYYGVSSYSHLQLESTEVYSLNGTAETLLDRKTTTYQGGFLGGTKRYYHLPLLESSNNFVLNTQSTTSYVFEPVTNSDHLLNLMSVTNTTADLTSQISFGYYSKEGTWCNSNPGTKNIVNTRAGETSHTESESYSYDSKGNVGSVYKNPIGQTDYLTYDKYGNCLVDSLVASSNDTPYRILSRRSFDATGRFLVKEMNHYGHSKSWAYDSMFGVPIESTDVNGLKNRYEYDSWGSLKKLVDKRNHFITNSLSWNIDTQKNSLIKKVAIDEITGQKTVYLDAFGREQFVEQSFQGGNTLKQDIVYDLKGQVATKSNTYLSATDRLTSTFTYDFFNRPSIINTSTGASISYSYQDRTASVTSPIQTSSKTVDQVGKTSATNDGVGNVSYSYYSHGGIKEIITPNKTIQVTYYPTGLRKQMIDPDAGTIEYTYNGYGELIQQKDSKGNLTYAITYDHLGRLVSKKEQVSGGSPVTYSYVYDSSPNGIGKITSATVSNGHKTEYTYNSFGDITSVKETVPGDKVYTDTYTYDNAGRQLTRTYPSGYTVRNVYDNLGFLVEIKSDNTNTTLWKSLGYNAKGKVTSRQAGNSKTTTYYYDQNAYLDSVITPAVNHWVYNWDRQKGQLTKRWNKKHNIWETFTYDVDRLSNIYKKDGSLAMDMDYDAASRIETKSNIGTYNYNGSSVVNSPASITDASNELPTSTQLVEYNAFNSPSKITEGNLELTLIYGNDQQRIRTVLRDNSSGTDILKKTFLNNYEFEQKQNKSRELHYLFAPDGLFAIVVKQDNTYKTYYTYTDYLGSIQEITDESGQVVEEMSFDAWGRRRNAQTWAYLTPSANGLWAGLFDRGYTGHEHLDAFNIINMNGRLYDPVLGLMYSPDNFCNDATSVNAFNRFLYANGNPMKFTDPNGEWIHLVIGAVIGGIVNFAIKASNGQIKSFKDGFVAFGIGAVAGVVATATGGAAFGIAGGGLTLGAGGVLAGSSSALVSSAFSMPILSMGNSAYFGDPPMTAKEFAIGLAFNTATGGLINGVFAKIKGLDFLTGKPIPQQNGLMAPIPMRQDLTNLKIDQAPRPTPDLKLQTQSIDDVLGSVDDELIGGGELIMPKGIDGQSLPTKYYPENAGALDGWVDEIAQKGQVMDRFGSTYGSYASPAGTPSLARALPPGTNLNQYTQFEIVEPFAIQKSVVAPAFGKPGYGIQYKLPESIETLQKWGWIIKK